MITYKEFKNRKGKYYLCLEDDDCISKIDISTYVGISYEELISIISKSKGSYTSKLGWYFSKEENIIQCCVLLNLIKQ